ncbi:GH25 family lysozyme [Actinacidiphila sp. DG2A-62]|uniref:glycoside hydrolase family 25 protein n=1 Tax=Actinacidiphila sp. DG2A-62 TaxID=3108821 RepID=UPI002DBCF7CB|nr:GH25 family lysozyme [Actinacidiphila sp. DG2A-62]MEC3994007.1 GH25 family lysozyme [Actinacidiphila sp. DG2A-62]
MTEGIDVASYQSTSYSTAGLGFVFVKATEGTSYVNPHHAGQVATGRAHSLVVGHYHFARPGSMTAQAAYFLKQAAPKAGDVLAFDWEDAGVSGADKDAWIKHVQAEMPHNRVLLYCNRDFWLNRDTTSFAGDGLWIADPDAPKGQPRVNASWLIHQYSEAGGLDRDFTPLTAEQLRTWAAGQTVNPEDDMAITDADVTKFVNGLATYLGAPKGLFSSMDDATSADDKKTVTYRGNAWNATFHAGRADANSTAILAQLKQGVPLTLTDDQVTALATKLAANPTFASTLAHAICSDFAARLQS